jgi:hypothetical protein
MEVLRSWFEFNAKPRHTCYSPFAVAEAKLCPVDKTQGRQTPQKELP